jgi:glucoside 3-dehydrogenase (cytochrome c) hitch-hiker subunit
MNRRQSLLYLSALAGHVLFPQVLEAFGRASLALAQAPGAWEPEILTKVQADVLPEVVETILPTTATPGAKAARVHVFTDLLLARCVAPAERTGIQKALDDLAPGFVEASSPERQRRLRAMGQASFSLLKEITLLGYFTSEIGCTQALAYEAVPGEYKGCLDLKPGQKAWATR